MVYTVKRMGLTEEKKVKKKKREIRRYPELTVPGEKVQVDVKEVPYNCLRGKVLRDNKHLYPVDGNRRMYPNKVCIRL